MNDKSCLRIPLQDIIDVINQAKPAEGMPRDWSSGCTSACGHITRAVAGILVKRNKDFDAHDFLRACGEEPGTFCEEE